MTSQKVKIEIWSDVVCPFCYLGKMKLQKALKKLNAEDQVEVIWHSFQLDPDFPQNTSMNSTQYLIERKGFPASQIGGIHQNLINLGKSYNIQFEFNKSVSVNTLNAHRLWQWSKTLNKSNELKDALLQAHFTLGMDLSKTESLLNIAEKAGLNKSEAENILNSEKFTKEVEYDIYLARQLGIRGVPYFLINEKESISGAQDDQVFEDAITKALTYTEKSLK